MTRFRAGGNDFSHLIDNIEDYAVIILNEHGIIEDWNKGAEKIKGYEASEIIGQSFKIFYSAEDLADELPERLLSQAAKNNKAHNEGWRIRKDGSRFWAVVSITAIRNADNELEGFIKMTRDLSERKKTEELLMQKNAMLLEAERTAKMCSWTWDVTSDMFGWSEAACDIFDMRVQYTMNYNRFLRCVYEEDRAYVHQTAEDIFIHNNIKEFNFRVIDGQNRVKHVLVSLGKTTTNEKGNIIRITGILQDITEKMSYVSHIREKNRKLTEIAQLQSHIVRSQVANILGICEVFDMDNMNSTENKELLLELKRSTEKLDEITRNIVNKTYDNISFGPSYPILPGEWI